MLSVFEIRQTYSYFDNLIALQDLNIVNIVTPFVNVLVCDGLGIQH